MEQVGNLLSFSRDAFLVKVCLDLCPGERTPPFQGVLEHGLTFFKDCVIEFQLSVSSCILLDDTRRQQGREPR